jgi:hypothetical protein
MTPCCNQALRLSFSYTFESVGLDESLCLISHANQIVELRTSVAYVRHRKLSRVRVYRSLLSLVNEYHPVWIRSSATFSTECTFEAPNSP